jgi:hypothetical protein
VFALLVLTQFQPLTLLINLAPYNQNPCSDRRLLDIWADQERCHRFPSILVVGPQRSGSSALHAFLRIHPSLMPNRASKDNFEELQFFNSRAYLRGIDWYLRHFPAPQSGRQLLFEKSANYFDNELTPKRVQALLPNARILLLLVDPVRRAYSWYQVTFSFVLNYPVFPKLTLIQLNSAFSLRND